MEKENYQNYTTKINWKNIESNIRAKVFKRLQEDFESALEYHQMRQDAMPNGYELGLTQANGYTDNELKTQSKLWKLTVDVFLEDLYEDRCYEDNGMTIFRLDNDMTNYLNYYKK